MTDPLPDAWRVLATPLGELGSGRVRYGAAMTLYQSGLLSADRLEAYRIASARDHRAAEGQGTMTAPPDDAPSAIAALVAEADRYLAALPGEGAVDVRRGLANWAGGAHTGHPSRMHRIVEAHLGPALSSLGATHPALAAAIAAASPHLDWHTYDGYPPEAIGADFAGGHAYASFVGEDAPIQAEDFDLGIFLIAPHVLYRDHCHAAPELYAPLTGPHGWRFGPDAPLLVKPAHEPVWNPSYRPHMTKVGPTPFLCLFGWTREVNELARVIPATDWAQLEALRLG